MYSNIRRGDFKRVADLIEPGTPVNLALDVEMQEIVQCDPMWSIAISLKRSADHMTTEIIVERRIEGDRRPPIIDPR